jgi:hypothetical protein
MEWVQEAASYRFKNAGSALTADPKFGIDIKN